MTKTKLVTLIEKSIEKLSDRTFNDGIFSSEADLQFQFGYQMIDISDGEIKDIIFEYPVWDSDGKISRIDLVFITKHDYFIPVEFKYFTNKIPLDPLGNQPYGFLRKQNDSWRTNYYFSDMERIERFVESHENSILGFTFVLSNHPSFWNGPKIETNYQNFSMVDGREVKPGVYEWLDLDKATRNGKSYANQPTLKGTYIFSWEDYHTTNSDYKGFKYMYNIYSK